MQSLGDAAFWVLTSLAGQRLHGYAIVQQVQESSEGSFVLKATTLYTVLDRLTLDGLVQPDGEATVAGRVRRYYRITSAGSERLQQERDALAVKVQAATSSLQSLRPAGGAA